MKDYIKDKIKQWLSGNTIASIENNGSISVSVQLKDEPTLTNNGVIFTVVFSRYQMYKITQTIVMEDSTHAMGMVLALPSYWLSVPFDLLIKLIENYLDKFLDTRNEYDGYETEIANHDDLDPNFTVPDNCPIL